MEVLTNMMTNFVHDLVMMVVGAVCAVIITRLYCKQRFDRQNEEFIREQKVLEEALRQANATDSALITHQHIDEAVAAWKQSGDATDYLDSLTNLSDQEKAKIYHAASLRHEGKEPKDNPYGRVEAE